MCVPKIAPSDSTALDADTVNLAHILPIKTILISIKLVVWMGRSPYTSSVLT